MSRRLSLALLGVIVVTAMDAGAMDFDGFGRCLERAGATFYGTSWCPHCREQIQRLGDAMRHVKYVECSVAGEPRTSTAACKAAKIEGYPTWTFADGSRAGGGLSLQSLARRTGCAVPDGVAPTNPAAAARNPSAPRPQPKHARIIEVP
jgi:hypothetical protein